MARWSDHSYRRIEAVREAFTRDVSRHIPRSCTHVRGHGGVKGAIRTLRHALPRATFVARFDIAAYYDSIRHDVLLNQWRDVATTPEARTVVRDYLQHPDTRRTGCGLVAGGGLSPLLGGLYLAPLDGVMERLQQRGKLVVYVRFMDDVVLLSRTRWHLKQAIAALHAALRPLHLTLHRTKRFIGRTATGFDFLGYRLRAGRKLRPSVQCLQRLRTRARRLYEQGADLARLRQYVARWWRWLHGGLWTHVAWQGGVRRISRHVLAHLHLTRPKGHTG